LRDYANFLGLDSGPLLEQYEQQRGRPSQEDNAPRTAKSSDRNATAVLGFAVLIILLMVGLAFYKPILSAVQHMTQPQPVIVPIKRRPTVTPKPTVKPPAPAPAPAPAPKPVEGVTIEARALQATWMRVNADGKQVFQGIMAPGQLLKWHGKRVVIFRTGNAGGVRLIRDGKPLPPLGKSGQIYSGKFVFTPAPKPPKAPLKAAVGAP
jgi:hypothetical protein